MTNDATTGLGYPRNPGPGWLRKESLARASPPGGCRQAGGPPGVGTDPSQAIKGGEMTMSEFMDEAKKLAGEHADLADSGFDKAEQFAEQKTGGKFDRQLQAGEQQAEGFLGVDDQDNQDGNQ
jgi:MT0933-like antitoxin protein